jgi:hypothetical protein
MAKIKTISRRNFLAGSAYAPFMLTPLQADASVRDVAYYSARSDMSATLACARMALSNWDHIEHYPIEDIKDMIFHRDGYFAFEAQILPILLQKGYDVKLHATTPYKDLAYGKGIDRYGSGSKNKIDIESIKWASKFLNDSNHKIEKVSFTKVIEWFKKGEFVMIGVSRNVLRNKPSLPYCRYNIVITGTDKNKVRYHDPSLGPNIWAEKDLVKKAFEAKGADSAVMHFGPIV